MYYFASDVHLGSSVFGDPRVVESRFVEWLRSIESDATALFLCGDIFDFWFEYERVVPKGFVRTLAQLAHLSDSGVRVVFMAGNHDMWIGNYLSMECGAELYTKPRVFELAGRRVHVAHGDNLKVGGNLTLRLMNGAFRSSTVRTLFSKLVHPDLAMRFGQWWSSSSRKGHIEATSQEAINESIERLKSYSAERQEGDPCDYYIFGHLHCLHRAMQNDSRGREYEVLFMNDWMRCEPNILRMDERGEIFVERV